MIRHANSTSNGWSPAGFDEFVRHYPATHWKVPESDLSRQFCETWQVAEHSTRERKLSVVLTPGLFAEWLPGCFRAAHTTFRRTGHRVLRSRVSSRLGVIPQSKELSREVSKWLTDDEAFVWCGHSKGGLELLYALESNPALRERCIAAIVVQPPVGFSHVLTHLGSPQANFGQRITNTLIGMRTFSEGVRDISERRSAELAHWLKSFRPCVPTVCVASWSIRPTSWVDSWHRILARVCPGIAHDGQFLTADQVLPNTALVALPRIDHAQPVLGGNGFDPGRFWQTLVQVALRRRMK